MVKETQKSVTLWGGLWEERRQRPGGLEQVGHLAFLGPKCLTARLRDPFHPDDGTAQDSALYVKFKCPTTCTGLSRAAQVTALTTLQQELRTVPGGHSTCRGDDFVNHTNVEPRCCTPEINLMLNVSCN